MTIAEFKRIARDQYGSAAIAAPDRTGLFDTAKDNLGMVAAYLCDGDMFHSSGDAVNALAAFSYALGWLHCGAACGLFMIQDAACPFREPQERLPGALLDKLAEKTCRYNRLLATAAGAVSPAAEAGTVPCRTAARVHLVVTFYAGQGGRFLSQNRTEDALACFSYGHGWLDAGVRAGLFGITASRDLFTV